MTRLNIWEMFQRIIDFVADWFIVTRRALYEELLRERFIPLPQRYKTYILEYKVGYELTDEMRGLYWKDVWGSMQWTVFAIVFALFTLWEFQFGSMAVIFGRYLGPFMFGFMNAREWRVTTANLFIHSWQIYKAYTSTFRIGDDGTVSWSSEFLWQALCNRLTRGYKDPDMIYLQSLKGSEFRGYLRAWSDHLHTDEVTDLDTITNRLFPSTAEFRGGKDLWQWLDVGMGDASKQSDRTWFYDAKGEYEQQAEQIGKIMGTGDFGWRAAVGMHINIYHSPNRQPNPIDFFIRRLDLIQLPKNMEVPEHYPEAFFKRSGHVSADKIRWATEQEPTLFFKLNPKPSKSKWIWDPVFKGVIPKKNRRYRLHWDFTEKQRQWDEFWEPVNLVVENIILAIWGPDYAWKYEQLAEFRYPEPGHPWLGWVGGDTFLVNIYFKDFIEVMMTEEGLKNNVFSYAFWILSFVIVLVITFLFFFFFQIILPFIISTIVSGVYATAYAFVYVFVYVVGWESREPSPLFAVSFRWHKKNFQANGFLRAFGDWVRHEFWFCVCVNKDLVIQTLSFFPRLFLISFVTCRFMWRFVKCFLKHSSKFLWHIAVVVYLQRDLEDIAEEDMTEKQLRKWKNVNEGKDELIYTYWGNGLPKTVRINPFWERDYMDDDQNEFFAQFRATDFSREGVPHYLTAEELRNDPSDDFYIGVGADEVPETPEEELARKILLEKKKWMSYF